MIMTANDPSLQYCLFGASVFEDYQAPELSNPILYWDDVEDAVFRPEQCEN
jgi:hypothetical protein